MKINTRLLLCACAFAVIHATPVFAGNNPGDVTLTFSDAYYHFDNRRKLQNVGVPNLAIAYNFTQHIALEGGIGVFNTNQRGYSQRGVHGYLYTVDGLYRFTPYARWEPYVLFGIGAITLYPQLFDSEHQGNMNAGIGTQFFADNMIALRGEIRDIYTLSGGKNDVMVNFGISFLFGDGKGPKVVEQKQGK